MREALVGYGFVAVPMAVFLLFFIYPIVYALYISLFDWGVFGKIETLGLGELPRAVARRDLLAGDQEHGLYTAVVVPLQMALGLVARGDRQRRHPGQDVLPLRLLLPLARLLRGDHRDRASTSSPPTGC